ncbi:MAG: efflux RND transporter permease subunit, partial [Desulfuromusa sp.]|nr:efflux RND transporter permease subunit [Desulfuromusa sp.]
MNRVKLNPAGRIAEVFVTSKLTPLFILACAILGVFAVTQTPREENPQILVPGAEIMVTLPGASALEVEQMVVNPIEACVRQINGVDHTFAVAMNSIALIQVQFEVGEDKERSLVKIHDRLQSYCRELPADASKPIVRSIDVDDVPIVTVTLASEKYDDYALKRLADRMVERLRSLEEVSVTYVKGGRDRELRIELDPERLHAYGISWDIAQKLILAANIAAPVGTLFHQGEKGNLFVDGFFKTEQDVRKLIVGSYQGRPVYLRDVATIVDGPPTERQRLSRFTFGPAAEEFTQSQASEIPAVTVAVAKKPGTNAVFVAADILDRIERIQSSFIPDDVHVITTRNDGQRADDSVNLLIEHLGIALISVFVVAILFLGVKEALIVGLCVPLILGMTLGADFFFGVTINRITLFALILSLGLLVDAAIVVIENIHRHYKKIGCGDTRLAAVLATNEIGNPTNLATFAIMLVFSSMIILTGMPSAYFFPITFNVPVAMLASLVVAYIVTPWAANRWIRGACGHGTKESAPADRLQRLYHASITPILNRSGLRALVFLGIGLLIILAVAQVSWQFVRPQGISGPLTPGCVAVGMLPKDNKNTFNITIDMPEYTPVEITDQVAREVGAVLRKNAYVSNYQTWIGEAGVIDFNGLLRGSGNKQGDHVAEIRVNLMDKKERSVSSIDLVQELRPEIKKIQARYPKSVIQLVEDPPGPPVQATVSAEIYGSDLSVLRGLSGRVRNAFQETYDMVDVHDSEVEDARKFNVTIDKEKAALSGVSTAQIVEVLGTLVHGTEIGRLHMNGEKRTVPIRVHVPRRFQVNPENFSRIFVSNPQGQKIPVSELVNLVPSWQDRPIQHKDYERVSFVGGELASTSQVYAVLDLDNRLQNLPSGNGEILKTGNLTLKPEVPDTIDGYQLFWGGEMRMTLDIYRDLGGALLLALTFIYLLLVSYYRSFSIPLVAMSAIPLGAVGVFGGHLLMGQMFSGPSVIGIIALSGTVVRNSLLIIDFVLDYMKDGMPLYEAIREAGAIRLRPILLTALAIV